MGTAARTDHSRSRNGQASGEHGGHEEGKGKGKEEGEGSRKGGALFDGFYRRVRPLAAALLDRLDHEVRENPRRAVAIAFGAGLLTAAAMRGGLGRMAVIGIGRKLVVDGLALHDS